MREKGPWSETPDTVFDSRGSVSHEAGSLSQDAGMSECNYATDNVESASHALSAGGSLLDEKSVLEDNVCQYPLDDMSKTDNELGFLSNEHEPEENIDFLDYGWLEIENFEDVDRMFRNCDSTFGMDSLNNDEDLCWLASSHDTTEESQGALKSNLKFTCSEEGQLESILDYNGDSKVNNLESSVLDFSPNPFDMRKNMSSGIMDVDAKVTASQAVAAEITASGLSSITSEGYIISDVMDDLLVKEKKKHPRQQKVSKGSKKDFSNQIGDYGHHCAHLEHCAVTSNDCSRECNQQLNVVGQHGSLNYVQANDRFMRLDQGGHALDGTSPCRTFSASKTGNDDHSSYSPKESSYASYMESTQRLSSENSALATTERREKQYYHPITQVPSRHFKSKLEASAVQSENENEGQSKMETGFRIELESPNLQESPSMNSELEDISVEATSFRQLQKVMEQLDIKTKLCIRDSLYRLAKSAEQRHHYFKGQICRDTMPLDNDSGFVDMETETNPIDRSIAHLLFHRPSDPSTLPVSQVHLKSNAVDDSPPGAEQKLPMDDG